MTNGEHIRNLSDKDLAEYINSVFISGRFYEKHQTELQHLLDTDWAMIDYEKWLKEDFSNEKI